MISEVPKYRRVLLKLSGESLSDETGFGIHAQMIQPIIQQIKQLSSSSSRPIKLGIVVGAGNYIRGAKMDHFSGIRRVTVDQMGMLATMINALALRDILLSANIPVVVLSAKDITGVMMATSFEKIEAAFAKGQVIVFAGGTGNPLVTTDTTASLRAVEMQAEIVLKATTVDGIYTADPKKDPHARKYRKLTFKEAISKKLAVMDQSAFLQCQEFGLPICVFDLTYPDVLEKLLLNNDQSIGTWVE